MKNKKKTKPLRSDKSQALDQTLNNLSKYSTANSNSILSCKNPLFTQDSYKKLSSNLIFRQIQESKSLNKIRIKRSDLTKKKRVDSLELLMKNCHKIQDEIKTDRTVLSYKKINEKLNSLRNSIEHCQSNIEDYNFALKSEKNLRAESKHLSNQLSYTENLRKQTRCVWKFSTNALSRRTERLMSTVESKINNKKRNYS